MATFSSILAWRIPGTGEAGGLPSTESHRVGHDWSDLAAAAAAECPYESESDSPAAAMSNSVRPHRWQPTSLPRPWDSPGKNTGVGCHFLLQCIKVKVKSLSRVWPSATLWTAAFQAPPSMGFSRQEYWSGVPLPSLKVAQLCPTLCKPMDYTIHEFSSPEYWSG